MNFFAIGGTFLLQSWMGLIIGQWEPDATEHYPPIAYTVALLFTATGTLLSPLWYMPLARASTATQEPLMVAGAPEATD